LTRSPGAALEPILRPARVAVLGASARRRTLGNQVLDNLRARGFPGEVTVIHPRGEPVGDWSVARSPAEVTGPIDVAMVSVPAATVAATLAELDAHGCRAAIVPAAGFPPAEASALARAAGELRMAVHGPNCLGVLSVASSAPLWTARLRPDLAVGPVAIVAQSGSAAISMMTARELGFSRVVSTGNELAVTSADYLHWLADDEATEVVGVITESIRDPARFATAAAALRAAGKPLVALKVGRTAGGVRATVAHTGALVNRHDVYTAFFRRLGVPVVADYDELVASLHCLVAHRGRRPPGRSVGIVAISGGQSALACDLADEMGATVAAFAEVTRERLRVVLPGVSGENPVDLHASVDPGRDAVAAVDAVLADPSVDTMLVVQDAQDTLPLSASHMYLEQLRLVIECAGRSATPTVIASSSSAPIHPLVAELLDGSPLPVVRGLREAVVAVRSLAAAEPPRPATVSGLDGVTVAELREALRGAVGPVPRRLADRILTAYDLPPTPSEVVADAPAAAAAAERIGPPVVVKVVSAAIPHRADVGGVVLGVRTPQAAAAAVESIRAAVAAAAPDAVIDGYEVQPEVVGAVEVLLGCTSTPPFGATVVVGSGGALAELAGDARVELAPVPAGRAIEMIGATRAGRVLAGYRNLVPATDLTELAGAVQRLSWLADDLGDLVGGVDLNPVLVAPGSGRITIVDALLTAVEAPAG
jgi:acetate---CoA ligase (ADP-forming)